MCTGYTLLKQELVVLDLFEKAQATNGLEIRLPVVNGLSVSRVKLNPRVYPKKWFSESNEQHYDHIHINGVP